MIVDLLRNDLGKHCVPGTVKVPALFAIESFPAVHHLVSTVTGTLSPKADACDLLRGAFPGGSITGAPKVRAAELIRGVERKRRGSYGGAVGYLAGNGDFDSCIVIRSAYVQNGTAYIQAGAGVVYDSVAQAEADETRSKAQAVINAIQSAGAAL